MKTKHSRPAEDELDMHRIIFSRSLKAKPIAVLRAQAEALHELSNEGFDFFRPNCTEEEVVDMLKVVHQRTQEILTRTST
jgi:hypothetical protein